VKVVVLVGGFGTRLRPLTFSIPKPLLPVGERPLLQLILERLRDDGFDEVVLATGYHDDLIRAFCGDGSRFGVRVSYVHEENPLGTAGALSLLGDLVGTGEFLLMNGDIVTTFDLRRLADFRRSGDYALAVAYTKHVYNSPFGVLTVRGSELVEIIEKPSLEQLVSAGIYAVGPGVASHVPPRTFFTMPQLIEKLLRSGRRVGALEIEDIWMGLEGIAQFEEAIQTVEAFTSVLPAAKRQTTDET
jgi:NDP-sugar pyrophosphorylase family protein